MKGCEHIVISDLSKRTHLRRVTGGARTPFKKKLNAEALKFNFRVLRSGLTNNNML